MIALEDAAGRVTAFDWCSCGALNALTDPLGRTTSWNRDLQGRLTAKVYPDQTEVKYVYEATTSRLKAVTDAKGQTTQYQYWLDDNLRQVTYTNALITTPAVAFTYESGYNRLASMADGIGVTSYTYHPAGGLGAGRLAAVDGPLANDVISYSYDVLGRVQSRAINGVAVNVSYDALGRVTTVTNVLGSFTNSYVNATERLSATSYPNGQSRSFSYDAK